MEIEFRKKFKKQYEKLPQKVKAQFKERLALLIENNYHPLLNVHSLHGTESFLLSMNVTGDLRAQFQIESGKYIFYKIGTHSELY
jgi:mRNA-degrading endonuclease YafQ of YafQ-DinJ toxin-antitoxin module